MNETTKSILIWVLLALLLVFIGSTLYLIFWRRYTKERFAFFAVGTLGGLALIILLPLMGSMSFMELGIYVLNHVFKTSIPYREPTLAEYALAIIFWFGIARFIQNIHSNWDCTIKTQRQHDFEEKSIKTGLLEDFNAQLKALLPQYRLTLHQEGPKEYAYRTNNEVHQQKAPWHLRAAELLKLTDAQYYIDPEKDWHQQGKYYLSKYGKEQQVVQIHCTHQAPSTEDLQAATQLAQQHQQAPRTLLFVTEETPNTPLPATIDGWLFQYAHKAAMMDQLVDFTDYYRYIRKRYQEDPINIATELTLADMYTSSAGHWQKDNQKIDQVDRYLIQEWLPEKSHRHLAILGDYGMGKSTLSLKLTYELLEQQHERIPILIELRGRSPRNTPPRELLGAWSGEHHIQSRALEVLHEEGRLLLIFEGFDEMDLVGDRETRFNHFRSLWEFAKTPKAKLLFTGRPNFFLEDQEEKQFLGIQAPQSSKSAYCEALYLERFELPQIETALRKVDSNTRQGVLELAKSSSSEFYDLIARPSTLLQVSVVWDAAKFAERMERINSALVIREFIYHAYGRQRDKAIDTPLTIPERAYFMSGIAVGMAQENGYTNQIDKDTLQQIIQKLYKVIPNQINDTESAIAATTKQLPLKERIPETNSKMMEAILTDVRTCGILVQDTSKQNAFRFAHKSYLEYLVAEYYVLNMDFRVENNNKIADSLFGFSENWIPIVHEHEGISLFIAQIFSLKIDLNSSNLCKEIFEQCLGVNYKILILFYGLKDFYLRWHKTNYDDIEYGFTRSLIMLNIIGWSTLVGQLVFKDNGLFFSTIFIIFAIVFSGAHTSNRRIKKPFQRAVSFIVNDRFSTDCMYLWYLICIECEIKEEEWTKEFKKVHCTYKD